jgi:hypothetical protein
MEPTSTLAISKSGERSAFRLGIRNAAQRSENKRKTSFLNYALFNVGMHRGVTRSSEPPHP